MIVCYCCLGQKEERGEREGKKDDQRMYVPAPRTQIPTDDTSSSPLLSTRVGENQKRETFFCLIVRMCLHVVPDVVDVVIRYTSIPRCVTRYKASVSFSNFAHIKP